MTSEKGKLIGFLFKELTEAEDVQLLSPLIGYSRSSGLILRILLH